MLTVAEAIHQRRSVRSFTSVPVSNEMILEMLEAARQAPSGSNSQPWRFVVITDAEEKKELAKERFQVKKEAETAALDASSAILQRRALELSRETGIDVKELDNLDEVSMVEKALRFQLTKEPEEVKEFDSGESTGGTQVFSRRRIAEMPIEEYAKFKPEIEKALREGRVKE